MTKFFTAEVRDRKALVPTSSAESGGHLPHCQTPEGRENDKNYNKRREQLKVQEGDDTWGGRETEPMSSKLLHSNKRGIIKI